MSKPSAVEIVLSSKDEDDSPSEDQMDAADMLLEAIDSKDAEAVVEAFKALLYLCKE